MNELTLIKRGDAAYIDSREVADAIGKQHKNLLRDIAGYIEHLQNSNRLNFEPVNFFVTSTYVDSKGETRPCYLLSKMGCEMVANKLTGEKGVLFTAAYVTKFNEMEQRERAVLETRAESPKPRLGEYNAAARLVVRALKNAGTSAELIVDFLRDVYAPLGITVCSEMDCDDALEFENGDIYAAMPWYTAQEIAQKCGLFSLNGKPHAQAAACIINENLFVGAEHKRAEAAIYGGYSGVSVRYDSHALCEVMEWLVQNELPTEIYGFERTYYVQYYG